MPNEKEHRRQLAFATNQIMRGKVNATADVTLNASATATIFQDQRLGYYSAVTPAMAMTASGATALSSGIWFDTFTPGSGKTAPSITIHHASNSASDQKIRFLIIG